MRRTCHAGCRLSSSVRSAKVPPTDLETRWRSLRVQHERHEAPPDPCLIPTHTERVELPMLERAFERSDAEAQAVASGAHGYFAVQRVGVDARVSPERKRRLRPCHALRFRRLRRGHRSRLLLAVE